MKKSFYFRVLVILFLVSNCKEKQQETSTIPNYIPENKSQNVIVDLANLFSNTENDSLTHKIIRYEKYTTNQIAILTIDSLPKHLKIQRFGTEIANAWGIGRKDKDNGLLITLSKFDEKVAISTGIGTEKTISDYQCKVIIDSIMIPHFKNEAYYKGITKALDSIFILWD